MTTIDVQGPGAQPEGTSLPPPRPFGETSTLTLPRRRRAAGGQGGVVAILASPVEDRQGLSAAIMRADATPLTITF